MVLQYTMPVTIGERAPDAAATNASSTRRRRLVDAAQPQERAGLIVAGEPDEIGVAEAVADLGRLNGSPVALLEVAAAHFLEPDGDSQISAFDTVAIETLEQAGRAREPAGAPCLVASEHEAVPDPEPASHRGRECHRHRGAVDAPARDWRRTPRPGRACTRPSQAAGGPQYRAVWPHPR